MMEKYFGDVIAGVVVLVIGASVLAMVKATLNSFILKLEGIFVKITACDKQHERDAEEREYLRKDLQNHEDRLNEAGA